MTRDPPRNAGDSAWRTGLLVLVAALGALTLFALIVTLRGADRQRDEALRAQAHSYEVMILARTLAGSVARAEARLGRYVVAGEKQLGRSFVDQWTLAGGQLDRLDAITAESREQQALINRLRAAYQQRGAELSLIAASTNYGRNRQAFARFYQSSASPSLAAITRALEQVNARERRLLDARIREAEQSVRQSSRIARGLAIFGVLLVVGAAVLGWLTVRAVSQRTEAEAEADAALRRADELAEAVAAATAELCEKEARLRQVQKMEAVGQLTGGIAHDFNNMLAVVLGGLELARRHVGVDAEVARRHLDSASEGAERAAALTRRLLAFSREDALQAEPIDPGALVAGMSDLLDRTLGDGVELVVRNEAAGWLVHADRVQLENAILNLAVNARDAMDGRGTLTIIARPAPASADHPGEHVALAVTDTGHGMTPEVAERVFEPFFTTKEVGRGTGLGLSQTFAMADQLGGWIGLETAPGQGTTVTLNLPRYMGAMAEPVADVESGPAPALRRLRVLVVEDDPRVLATTLGALRELGHQPVACNDPLAAAEVLEQNPDTDLLISDVLMPRCTGPEMIAALPPRFGGLPVLFVTGFAGDTAASELDGHHLLRKPYTLAGLERAIAAATASSHPTQRAAA